MAELKTKPNKRKSVDKFIREISHAKRREDATALLALMRDITGEQGIMWGESIVGLGSYQYARSNGERYEWFSVGFSPRKAALVLYSVPCVPGYKDLVKALGPVKSSVSCVYITDLEKLNQKALKNLIKASFAAEDKLS